MPDVSRPGKESPPLPRTCLRPAGLDGLAYQAPAEAALDPECGTTRWMGVHRAVRAGVHGHHPAVSRAPAGEPVVEGQLAGGDRTGTQQPGARRGDRRPAGNVRQPVLRQDERPHVVAPGYAPPLDGHRPGGWFARSHARRGGTQHPGRAHRMVHRPAVLQRPPGRPGGGAARPGPSRPTRPRLGCPGRLSSHRLGERHLRGPAVHRQPARHVRGSLRDRRVLHPAVRVHAVRSPALQRRTSRPGRCGSSPARSTSTRGGTRTSPGPSRAGSCSSWRTPS